MFELPPPQTADLLSNVAPVGTIAPREILENRPLQSEVVEFFDDEMMSPYDRTPLLSEPRWRAHQDVEGLFLFPYVGPDHELNEHSEGR